MKPRSRLFVSVYTLNKELGQRRVEFDKEISRYFGTFMEEGDSSDKHTSMLKVDIHWVRVNCDAYTAVQKRNAFIRFASKTPLLPFIPVIKDRNLLLNELPRLEKKVKNTTARRVNYEDVSTYAFKPEEELRSLWMKNAHCAPWNVKFDLLATENPKRTWDTILGYSDMEFKKWWEERHPIFTATCEDGWADLKSLCKAVVYILDVVFSGPWNACLGRFSSFQKITSIAQQAREIATEFVIQYSKHPDQAYGISKLFGLFVPIVFTLSNAVQKAKGSIHQNFAIQQLVSETLSLSVAEIESLMKQVKHLLVVFSGVLAAEPFIHSEEDLVESKYNQGPLLSQLFNVAPEQLSENAKRLILDSRLCNSEAEMNSISGALQRAESTEAAEIVLQHSHSSRADYLKDLDSVGLTRKHIQASGEIILLGSGSYSVVSEYKSEDGSEVYAVKRCVNRGDAWSWVRKEATIWAGLDHENVLKLLGYCVLSEDEVPALVTTPCRGSSIDTYIPRNKVSERERVLLLRDAAKGMEYLHSMSVAHGDLRAANVLVQELQGQKKAVLCDFGMSRRVNEGDERVYDLSCLQQTACNWLAPELLCEPKEIVLRASIKGDIFAFGCVILEVVSEKKPYARYDQEVVRSARLDGARPANKDDMKDVYWELANSCWEVLPKSRPNARLVRLTLGDILENSDIL